MDSEHPLRRWRKSKGMTQSELAAAVGVVPSHLSEIERYENTPSLDLAARISKVTANENGIPEVSLNDFVR